MWLLDIRERPTESNEKDTRDDGTTRKSQDRVSYPSLGHVVPRTRKSADSQEQSNCCHTDYTYRGLIETETTLHRDDGPAALGEAGPRPHLTCSSVLVRLVEGLERRLFIQRPRWNNIRPDVGISHGKAQTRMAVRWS